MEFMFSGDSDKECTEPPNDKASGWPMVLAVPLRVASPLDWLVVCPIKLMEKTWILMSS